MTQVLVIEDSDTQRAMLCHALVQSGHEVASADTGAEGMRLMVSERPDIVLLDVVMPDMDGWQTLEQIRDVSGVPVIMLTAEDTERDRVRGLRTGADDYMSKPFGKEELAARIDAVLRRAGEARSDALTGLPNQRAFSEHIDGTLKAVRATGEEVSLLLFDLDNFKQINDTEGHPVGDQVLRSVARVVLGQIRLGEEAFRVGGEEFAVVVHGGIAAGSRVAERVRTALVEQRRERTLPTLSGGIAAFPSQADARDELVHRADLALYAAKAGGKNRVVVYDASLGD